MDWNFNLGLMPYGANWRRHRKVFHDHFNSTVVVNYDQIQLGEIRKFLGRLLEEPQEFSHHIHQSVTSYLCQTDMLFTHSSVFAAVIMDVVYGIKIEDSKDDPYVATIQGAMEGIAVAGVPGSFLVDYLPSLRHVPAWIPGASFQKIAARARQVIYELAVTPFNEVKEAMVGTTS